MMIFAGAGGNGESQTRRCRPYDNIWPHSSDLRGALHRSGHRSHRLHLRRPAARPRGPAALVHDGVAPGDDDDGHGRRPQGLRARRPVQRQPRVARSPRRASSPTSTATRSGCPTTTRPAARTTYGTWTLMAEDHSQNMDVVGKKELGWLVPRVLPPGSARRRHELAGHQAQHPPDRLAAAGRHAVHARGAGVNNGEAYVAPLPGRQIIDPADVPSGTHVYWSGAGNNFGCTPTGGHNVDIALPGLADVPAGTPVTLSFKSRFDIEWDFDYGFVLGDHRQRRDLHSLSVGKRLHDRRRPDEQQLLPGEVRQRDHRLERLLSGRDAGDRPGHRRLPAIPCSSTTATTSATSPARRRRCASATRPTSARTAGLVHRRHHGDRRRHGRSTSPTSRPGRQPDLQRRLPRRGPADRADAAPTAGNHSPPAEGTPADHALPARDARPVGLRRRRPRRGRPRRSARPSTRASCSGTRTRTTATATSAPTTRPRRARWTPSPSRASETPNLNDAAFTATADDSSFSDSGEGHVDNYTDPARDDGLWRFDFKCLAFNVARMAGTDVGPPTQGTYNLNGDVAFDTRNRLRARSTTGPPLGAGRGVGPTAVAQAKPERVQVGETVAFDGSASFDDVDAPENLKYAWEFGDGKKDRRPPDHARLHLDRHLHGRAHGDGLDR